MIRLAGREYPLMWDTGASISIVHEKIVRDLDLEIKRTSATASGITGHELRIVGQCIAEVHIGPRPLMHRFIVVQNGPNDLVLGGTDFMHKLGPTLLDLPGNKIRFRNPGTGLMHDIPLITPSHNND